MIAMAEEQLEWVFDSLIEFLRGPVWNIPILTFIEQKSVVFEPGSVHDGEFKKIHEEYKNLVDFMLGSYMDDLQINPEQFEKACSVASKKALTQFHKGLFEQVWAADDFEIFQRMMTQKNLELQLQALEVLASKFGLSPDFMNPGPESRPAQEEEKIMKEVIRRTMEENQEQQPCLQAVANSEEEAMQVAFAEKMRLEAERNKERELMEQALKLSVQESAAEEKTPPAPASTPTMDPTSIISCTIEQNPGHDARNKSAPSNSFYPVKNKNISAVQNDTHALNSNANPQPFVKERRKDSVTERPWSEGDQTVYTTAQIEASPLDVERRQNYLRQQRDRLLALKRQERTKTLNNIEEQTSEKRPKSARAARKILTQEEPKVDPQTLAFRKSLASRLRSEVVDSPVQRVKQFVGGSQATVVKPIRSRRSGGNR